MMSTHRPPAVAIAICVYCAFEASHLLHAWFNSPYDYFGWVAFGIWITPVFQYLFSNSGNNGRRPERPLLLGLGLFLSVQGMIGSFNVFQHMGLAFAVAGLMPPLRAHALWLGSAISWMPVFGWLGGRHFPELIHLYRFLLVAVPTAWMVYDIRREMGGEEA